MPLPSARDLVHLVAPPLCVACGADAARAAPLCPACRRAMRPAPVRLPGGCWAAFAYDGPAGAMVRALKFRGYVAIADVMAAQVVAHAPDLPERAALVPVPAHRRHRRRRGFDHAHALAEAIAGRTGLDVCDCLVREGDARPQVGRGRGARMAGVAGRIRVRDGISAPRAALVVDDVVTTGATFAACADALRAAGSVRVSGLVFAATEGR